MKTIQLKNGMSLPVIGFGTSQLKGEVGVRSVQEAIEVGYRHIDTADMYGNHREVGQGIKNSGIAREQLFVTTKVSRDDLTADAVRTATQRFLEELQLSYVDLLLIHWPNKSVPLAETLGAMEEIRKAGLIRAIGVSNFTEHHLADAAATGIEVVADQVEVHPTFNQKPLREYCAGRGVAVIAYAPLGRGSELNALLLTDLAKKYGVSTAQISLNWLLSRGVAVIPRSSNRAHMEDSLRAQEWQMEEMDLVRIDALPQGERLFKPATHEFDY